MFRLISCVFVLAVTVPALAKDPVNYEKGVLAEMTSVPCGYIEKSGHTVAGAIITGGQHSKSREVLCQEYTLKTDRVSYRIRPKEEKHPALLPVGDVAEFRLKKDTMLLRIPESDNKERQYFVVAMTASTELANAMEKTLHPPKPHVDEAGRNGERAPRLAVPESSGDGAATAAAQPQTPLAPTTTSSVQVQSVPAGAEVFVDSALVAHTPANLAVKPGSHSIQVVLAGYKDWVTSIQVAPGAQQQLTANLEKN